MKDRHRQNWCPEHGYWPQPTPEAITCPADNCTYALGYGPLAPNRPDPFPTYPRPLNHGPAEPRMELVRKFERVTHVPPVGFSLSVWAGRGGWASSSSDWRDQQGHQALSELDAMIEQLLELREQLNAELAASVPDQPVEYGVFKADGSELLIGGRANPADALAYAEPGQVIAVVCPHDRDADQPAAMCPTCRAETPRLANTTTVVPDDTPINLTITTTEGREAMTTGEPITDEQAAENLRRCQAAHEEAELREDREISLENQHPDLAPDWAGEHHG